MNGNLLLRRKGRVDWLQESIQLLQKLQRKHGSALLFLLAIAVTGLFFGGVVAGQIPHPEQMILDNRLQNLISDVTNHQLASSKELLWQRLSADGRMLALLWLLGLSIIGIPIIILLLFLRAFSTGFAIGYTILHFGVKGLWIAMLGIFLHEFLAYSTLLAAALTAIRFSKTILIQKIQLSDLIVRALRFTGYFIVYLGGLAIADWVQASVVPHLLASLF